MSNFPSLFADFSRKSMTGKRCGLWLLAVGSSIALAVPASAGVVLNSSYLGEGVPDCFDSYRFDVSIVVGAGVPDGSYSVYSINRAGNGTTHGIQITNGVPNPASFSVALGSGSESGGYGGGPYTASIQHSTGIYGTGTVVTDAAVTWTDRAIRRYYPQLGPTCTDYVERVTVTFGEPTADPTKTKCNDIKVGGDGGCSTCPGMARYSIHSMLVSLNVVDTPVSYSPPRGPAIDFTATYNQRDSQQPATFNFSNLGPKWTFNWVSYVIDDPVGQSSNILVTTRSGGAEVHAFSSQTQTYGRDPQSHADLIRTGPGSYEKNFPDGSREIYNLSDNAASYPRRIFLTQKRDPLGNTITIGYDSTFRVTTITDAIGQVSTISYDLPSDPLKITKVTNPFGVFATFEYSGGQLVKITDPVGIQSQFGYTAGTDSMSSLTTPYGTSTFVTGQNGTNRWIEATDPLGGKERVEYRDHAPGIRSNDSPVPAVAEISNGGLDVGNTFYWDKRAMMLAPGDYTKARITHWRVDANGRIAGIVSSKKEPLEARVWYAYVDNGGNPSKIARVLDDGSTQLSQYDYNPLGHVIRAIDPIGRTISSIYDVNNVDLLEVRQTTGSSNELLASYSYNSQHLPLTVTDASGQTTTNTYYPSGQLHTVTNAKQETTSYSYDSSGYLLSVTGAVPTAITSFSYDSFGRPHTTTDAESYTIVTEYDTVGNDPTKTLNRVARVTYPDNTYEETTYDRLDPEWTRDRAGRWSRRFYDALRHVVATQDPLNNIVLFDWCGCGSLESVTDAKTQKTRWEYDLQGRIANKVYADASGVHYVYEANASRLASVIDAKNQVTNYQYFADDNIKQVSYTNAEIATPSVNFTYDPNYNRVTNMTDGTGATQYVYNGVTDPPALGAGRLHSVDGPLVDDTITYLYDELGRSNSQSINGAANTSNMEYDSLGRVQNVTNALGTLTYHYVNITRRIEQVDYPNGQKAQYSYFDNVGGRRLQQIKNIDQSSALLSQFDYTYDADGRIATWMQSDPGHSTARRYDVHNDATGRLRSANSVDPATGNALAQYSFDYDAAGNHTNLQIGEKVSTVVSNGANQLQSISSGGGLMHFRGRVSEPASITVGGDLAAVDAEGNFDGTANVVAGSNTVTITATDASGNAKTNTYQISVPNGGAISLDYDANGNLINDFTKTYEWDAADRLVAINYIEQPYRTEFTYDGLNRCVKIVELNNGTVQGTKNFVWLNAHRAEERDADNYVVKRFFQQGEVRSEGRYFYTRDHLLSIREITDESGAVRGRFDYDPVGRRTQSGELDVDFGFTGYYWHSRSNLHFAPFRAYSAELGTWISRDPIGENGGLNLYAYGRHDPINRVDPLGFDTYPRWGDGTQTAFDAECWQCTNWAVDDDQTHTYSDMTRTNYTSTRRTVDQADIPIPLPGGRFGASITILKVWVHMEWDEVTKIFRDSVWYRVCYHKPERVNYSDVYRAHELLDTQTEHKKKDWITFEPDMWPPAMPTLVPPKKI